MHGSMISQLFILAPNGHTIVHKDYRGDVPKDAPETFLRKVVEKTESSPIFQVGAPARAWKGNDSTTLTRALVYCTGGWCDLHLRPEERALLPLYDGV